MRGEAPARTPSRLPRTQLPSDPVALARYLIGKSLVRETGQGRVIGRIVETEAYPHDDPASHGFAGPTARNAPMFLPRGHAYVYLIYGLYRCLNVAAGAAGTGAGVLLRAIEPIEGAALMQARRGRALLRDLGRGPGRLCIALDVTLSENGIDLCQDATLWIGSSLRPARRIGASARIGLSKATERRLRFFEAGSGFLSGRAVTAGSARTRRK